MNLTSHFHLVRMSRAVLLLPQYAILACTRRVLIYGVLEFSPPTSCGENTIFKNKISFSVLHYARNHSCGNIFFIYVYSICIYSCINMLRGTVTTKIRFLVNLEENKLNQLQMYTTHTSRSVNLLMPNDFSTYHQV